MFVRDPAIVPLFLAACTSFFPACTLQDALPEPAPPLRAYFIDVGQGDACLLRTPEGKHVLYDLGNRQEALAAFLGQAGVDTLEAVFLSHADLDHFGAFAALHDFPVNRWFLPETKRPDPAWNGLMEALDARGAKLDTLHAGDTVVLGGKLAIRALWPPRHFSGEDNETSLVLRITYGASSLLLTGDIEAEAEAGLLASGAELAGDLLKVPHHGSRTSSALPFLGAIRPRWAVISCDSSVYGHPHPETLAGLGRFIPDAWRILRTDREGTVAFALDPEGVRRIDPRPARD